METIRKEIEIESEIERLRTLLETLVCSILSKEDYDSIVTPIRHVISKLQKQVKEL